MSRWVTALGEDEKFKIGSKSRNFGIQVDDSFDLTRCTNEDLCLMGKDFHLCVEPDISRLKCEEPKGKKIQQFKKLLANIFRPSRKEDINETTKEEIGVCSAPSDTFFTLRTGVSEAVPGQNSRNLQMSHMNPKWCLLQNVEHYSELNFLPNNEPDKCIRLLFPNSKVKKQMGEGPQPGSSTSMDTVDYTISNWSPDCVKITTEMDVSSVNKFLQAIPTFSSSAWAEMCDCIEAKTGQRIGKEIVIQVLNPKDIKE